MAKKVIFLIVFVPVHFLLMLVLLQYYWFNYNARLADLFAQVCHIPAAVFAVPLLTLLGATGISEYSPLWLQLLALAFYSLLWAIFVLAVWAIIKRCFGIKPVPQGF
jgi:membrane-associated HD superfamily phosphohydrolase